MVDTNTATVAKLRDWADRIQPLTEEYLDVSGTPGLAIALVHKSGATHFINRGVAANGGLTPITSDSWFQIGSITKSMVSLSLLRACEQKLCALQDAIKKFLPWLGGPAADSITLEMLLTHTSGLPTGTSYAIESRLEAYHAVASHDIASIQNASYYYSNIGYTILGFVLEALYKKPLAQVLSSQVFVPLAMRNSLGSITAIAQPKTVQGYRSAFDIGLRLCADPLVPAEWEMESAGAGCVISNARDMSNFVACLLNRGVTQHGAPLLSEDSFANYIRSRAAVDRPQITGYGLGVFVSQSDTKQWISHTGGMIGFRTSFVADLRGEYGIVILTNLGIDQRSVVGWRFAAAVISAAPDKQNTHPIELRTLLPAPLGQDYIGAYRDAANTNDSADWRITSKQAGGLSLETNVGSANLEWFDGDRYAIDDPELRHFELRFIRDGNNKITGLQHGSSVLAKIGIDGAIEIQPTNAALLPFLGKFRTRNPWHPILKVIAIGDQLEAHISDIVAPLTLIEGLRFSLSGTPEIVEFSMLMDDQYAAAAVSGCVFFREHFVANDKASI
jgi:D-alanyl-D-alanine carboxypeptidase